MTPSPPSLRELRGSIYDVRNLDSIAILFSNAENLRGLYRLSFDNGEAYVGQSINVVTRFVGHRKRWDDIVTFEFFPIPTGDLDDPERQLITWTEASTDVRNVRDTRRPHGEAPLEIVTDQGFSVALPWKRDTRTRPDEASATRSAEKFRELACTWEYEVLRDLVGWYLYETIPDAVNTARQLWTSTCLPSTNKNRNHRRLLVVNAGNLEVLVASQNKKEDQWVDALFINTDAIDDIAPLQDPDGMWLVEKVRYSLTDVTTWHFPRENFESILRGEIEFPHLDLLVESAYRLNVRLMRQGSTMFRRFHNDELATDLLSSSLKWGNEDWWKMIRTD